MTKPATKIARPLGPHTHTFGPAAVPRWLVGGGYYNDKGFLMGLSPSEDKCYLPVPRPVGPVTNPALPGDWLASLTSAERKEVAMSRGLKAYFPDALALIARHSVRMNQKHNPGQPVHWSREKSSDHEDCIERHGTAIAIDPDSLDDGQPHIVARGWRALAALQLWAEKQKGKI
jgi:hypothetical protein